ncbi:MAG TPA: peptidylprolyl isomerase, partial [Solirubrobacterales bacterium]|nr:peptidylprolyl isomerase [Solirubrobacterales bacterium]
LMALIALGAVLALVVVVVLVTGGDDGNGGENGENGSEVAAAESCEEVERPAPKQVNLEQPQPGTSLEPGEPAAAVVETSCGSFTIELDTARAPKTAESFAYLAERGAFDDTFFHRIAPDFVIQGGDPRGDGTGGPGYQIREAPPTDLTYEPGTVAMAKTEDEPAGTSGSQFFVITGAMGATLTPDYALVGEVTDGMDVVDTIGALGGPDQQPTETVVIESVTVEAG